MSTLKNWVLALSVLAIIHTILENLIPNGNIKNTAKTILKITILLAAFTGFTKLKQPIRNNYLKINSSSIHSKEDEINKKLEKKLAKQVKKLASKNLEAETFNVLKNNGISAEKINIFMNTKDPNNVFINKATVLLKKKDITKKEQTQALVKDFLNLRTPKEIEVSIIP